MSLKLVSNSITTVVASFIALASSSAFASGADILTLDCTAPGLTVHVGIETAGQLLNRTLGLVTISRPGQRSITLTKPMVVSIGNQASLIEDSDSFDKGLERFSMLKIAAQTSFAFEYNRSGFEEDIPQNFIVLDGKLTDLECH